MRVAVAALLCVAVTARADDPIAARRAAEQLERDAEANHDETAFTACGRAFLALFDQAPTLRDADELAYNAAVCFEQAHRVDEAAAAFRAIVVGFPQSRLTAKAMVRLARLAAQLGHLDEAAQWLEDYARKYAAERDAIDALSDAAYYRRALGDDDKRIADVDSFVRTYGVRRPADAASAVLSLTEVYERRNPANAIKHLQSYIASYNRVDERTVLAYARLGTLLWNASCPVTPTDGLCVKPRPACGVVTVRRDPQRAADARSAFKAAIAAYERKPDPLEVHWYAMAKLALADAELEAMGANAERHYDDVFALKDADATIATTARLGQLATFGACPASAALVARALEIFNVCLTKSVELGVDDSWTQLCRRSRAELAPGLFSAHDELLPEPATVWPDVLADPVAAAPSDSDVISGALATFSAHDGGGWDAASCRHSADGFVELARIRPALGRMIGLSYQRCGLFADARRAYERTGDPASIAALGGLEWANGHPEAAERAWRAAIAADDRQAAAHLGLAIALSARAGGDAKIAAEAERHLTVARGLDVGTGPLVVAGIRDLGNDALADYDLGEAENLGAPSLALDLARGSFAIHRGMWGRALDRFDAAIARDRSSDVAHLDRGLALLHVHEFPDANAELALVKRESYALLVARGVALRGLGKVADAAAIYRRAIALDPAQATALYNLGIVDKEYVQTPAALREASDAFHKAAAIDAKLDAKALADECDRSVAP